MTKPIAPAAAVSRHASAVRHGLPSADGPLSREKVVEAVRQHIDPDIRLAFVPAVVRALNRDVPEAHRALLEAARAGAIELRPESGLSRISAEELAISVPGPWETRLTWARVL